ncbi:hypothetical protein BKA60DRAFT_546918 [Fusarium oxysporum]|nr:hypothetical protein BKA60DRAFT_546918 [Fusarium oxysporum]
MSHWKTLLVLPFGAPPLPLFPKLEFPNIIRNYHSPPTGLQKDPESNEYFYKSLIEKAGLIGPARGPVQSEVITPVDFCRQRVSLSPRYIFPGGGRMKWSECFMQSIQVTSEPGSSIVTARLYAKAMLKMAKTVSQLTKSATRPTPTL